MASNTKPRMPSWKNQATTTRLQGCNNAPRGCTELELCNDKDASLALAVAAVKPANIGNTTGTCSQAHTPADGCASLVLMKHEAGRGGGLTVRQAATGLLLVVLGACPASALQSVLPLYRRGSPLDTNAPRSAKNVL